MIWSSIDPGVAYFAEALWEDRKLVSVHKAKLTDSYYSNDLLVIEKPQVYKTGTTQARNSDIVDLAISVGQIMARYRRSVLYLPAQWKGQVPKSIHQKRILAALEPEESKLLLGLTKEAKGHILDAVGLGLFHLKRLA